MGYTETNPQQGSQTGGVMVGRDGLRLLLLGMVGRFRPRYAGDG